MSLTQLRREIVAARRELLGSVTRAVAAGLKIVSEAFEVEDRRGKVIAVCLLGAHNRFGEGALGLPGGDDFAPAWDAIEFGFDGISYLDACREGDHGAVLPQAWWALGARLRKRLRPIRASSIRGSAK